MLCGHYRGGETVPVRSFLPCLASGLCLYSPRGTFKLLAVRHACKEGFLQNIIRRQLLGWQSPCYILDYVAAVEGGVAEWSDGAFVEEIDDPKQRSAAG